MTTEAIVDAVPSLCDSCFWFYKPYVCKAYPGGIPANIAFGADHRTAQPGDHGVSYLLNDVEDEATNKAALDSWLAIHEPSRTASLVTSTAAFDWDEDAHPRGPDGKFGPGDGSSKDDKGSDKGEAKAPAGRPSKAEYDAYRAKLDAKIDEALKTTGDTQAVYSRDGKYTQERQELHDKILDARMAKYAGVPADHQAIIMAGVPAAGKSSLIASDGSTFGVKSSDGKGTPENYATVNADDMKDDLIKAGGLGPEFDNTGLSPGESASLLHEESSKLAADLQSRLIANGQNILIDGTLAGSYEKQAGKLDALEKAGYSVKGVLVSGKVDNSLDRAMGRHTKGGLNEAGQYTGRYVPNALIGSLRVEGAGHSSLLGAEHENIASVNFEKLADKFNGGAVVYDNKGGTPQLLAQIPAPGAPPVS